MAKPHLRLMLSPSSRPYPAHGRRPTGSLFALTTDASTGLLQLKSNHDHDLLELVRHAKHVEPEGHVNDIKDALCDVLRGLGRDIKGSLYGLTDKDISFVAALSEQVEGFLCQKIFFPELHPLEVDSLISQNHRSELCDANSVLLVRHQLEHARELDRFFKALTNLMRDDTLCMIEVPDSKQLIAKGEITQLWEEHVSYFTSNSLCSTVANAGFDVLACSEIASDGEELCVVIVRKSRSFAAPVKHRDGVILADQFVKCLPLQILQLRAKLTALADRFDLYIFGGNHIAGTFLDIVSDAAGNFTAILDDDPEKHGLALGLFRVPIRPKISRASKKPIFLLVAVNEGRAPNLYIRLREKFSIQKGHALQPLALFCTESWGSVG